MSKVNTVTTEQTSSPVEDDRYVAFAGRVMEGLAKRAGQNLATLTDLVVIHDHTRDLIHQAVHQLRADGASWAHIGSALGITRQTAQQRFGGPGARITGGQRGDQR